VSGTISRDWVRFEPFDPEEGTVIRPAPGKGPGYWVGAPGAMYDGVTQTFYLAYRIRRPRGVHPDRGAEVHIARSADGVAFEDIWVGRKETLESTSIERCALTRLPDGRWGFFVSFVDPADGRWRIDLVEADRPERLDLAQRRPVLTAADINAEGVKDPFLFRLAGLYHMIVSFATADQPAAPEALHGTHDAFNTGLIKSRTGLATSRNGRDWTWEGEIIGPSTDGWDRYCTRIGTVWPQNGLWLALYDGSADVSENYEERVGLAYSFDLRRFVRVTSDGPLMVQPNASGALRYFDVLEIGDQTFLYYETACPDGSHDLRVFRRAQTR